MVSSPDEKDLILRFLGFQEMINRGRACIPLIRGERFAHL